MPDIVNPYAKRLYDSLINNTDKQTTEDIVFNMPLSKTASEKRNSNGQKNYAVLLKAGLTAKR
ncbi:MAG: hypothetical protein ACYCWE_05110 [Eubacteriales bacterium]